MEVKNVEMGSSMVLTFCDVYLVPQDESWHYPSFKKTVSSPDTADIVEDHLDAFSEAWKRLADL
jgi:hypothetical protein